MSPLTSGVVGRLTFAVDPISVHFVTFTVLIWLAVTVYSVGWFGGASKRFLLPGLAALGAVLGVFLAGDLLTLFLFFEALALLGFLLVRQGEGARGASIRYFWTMLVGGLALLAGIILHAVGAHGPASVLLILGFGVKAGMLPVHGWLPAAHAKAPAPASALLSGVMIKTGVYGILRVVADHPSADPLQAVLLALGLAGALYGAALALVQSDAKRLLAWSSVSQIGIILTGIGAGAWSGSLTHIASHASAKAVLFLAVGTVVHAMGTAHLPRLGGVWRAKPLTLGLSLVAGATLTGLPFLRASMGKAEIHHALAGIPVAEGAFFLASAGTVAVVLKLLFGLFLGPVREPSEAPRSMSLAMGIAALPILLPAPPTNVLYFAATAGLGTALYLAARRWSPARPAFRIPRVPTGWALPRPPVPVLPEARLRQVIDGYARETGANLALLFVVLLVVILVMW
jgi:formate hydrogenlyase subunit 3/multisubunit Na+/H+ antiporter MnhD subunit